MLRTLLTGILFLVALTSLVAQTLRYVGSNGPLRETRGVWVATVVNIDWPKKPGESAYELQKQALQILDNAKSLGLNVVFLQVRPSCDGIYHSKIEPLTWYLTEGNDDDYEGFDILDFWIEEAHKRGIELHAWINPFRVLLNDNYTPSKNHILYTHPEWVLSYDGKKFLDPGIPEARKYVCSVVSELCLNYDIDGIHFDDYFYPYPSTKNPAEPMGDTASFRLYNKSNMSLSNWRRQNVTKVIRQVQYDVKHIKPWLAFGISPFGVWMNKKDHPEGSDTRAGVTDYAHLYADVKQWIEHNWVDYVVPQLYWDAASKIVSFDVLSKWWGNLANEQTQIIVGHAIYRINPGGGKVWGAVDEMQQQIRKTQNDPKLSGSVFFSYNHFERDLLGLQQDMKSDLYKDKALTSFCFNYPTKTLREAGLEVKELEYSRGYLVWEPGGHVELERFYLVYRYLKGEQLDMTDPEQLYAVTGERKLKLTPSADRHDRKKYVFRVVPVDVFRGVHAPSEKLVLKM